jgi:hypothetical protein
MFNAVRFNNIYMAPPMGLNPFMGGCGCNSFNPMFQFGMMNSLFSMPQMFSFPSFSMPIFSPFSMMSGYSMPSMGGNIFSMANYSMPMFNPMMNFGLPAMFEQMNLLNKYTNNFGSLTSSLNNGTNTTSKTKKGQKTQKSNSKYNKNATELYTGTAEDLNKYLKGKGVLEGQGQAFLNAQKKYGISASVLAGICIHESGNGKSRLAKTKNNIGGVRIAGSTKFRTFNSVAECIDYMGGLLKRKYVNQGLTTLSQINSKYCPPSDPTDTTGTNYIWAQEVNKHANSIERATV